MSNESLNSPKSTTNFDKVKSVEFLGDKEREILESLNSNGPNYVKIIKDLRKIDSPKLTDKAFDTKNGARLFFLYYADEYMPLYGLKKGEKTQKIPDFFCDTLAHVHCKHNPPTDSRLGIENFKQAIANTQKQWEASKDLVSLDDRKAWRQTLIVNALSESTGADTSEAIKAMRAMHRGIDITKPESFRIDKDANGNNEAITIFGEKGHMNYMVGDNNVRMLILRYDKNGLEFYKKIIGNTPSESEQNRLALEVARRRTKSKSYDEIPKDQLEEIKSIVKKHYGEQEKPAA
ncbi:hypothetical protein IKG45_01680 [Candidatus Saccharibacteria bacterium]|nr:hypothetical protein [Candidatus Saccharibacteria bacterium]